MHPLLKATLAQFELHFRADERCLGLCPQCGKNRNREDCQCLTVMSDERWGALKDFREELLKKRES